MNAAPRFRPLVLTTREQWEGLYDLLTTELGASPSERDWFVESIMRDDETEGFGEFRVLRSLGWGGKLKIDKGYVYLTMYAEDETPARLALMEKGRRMIIAYIKSFNPAYQETR